MSRRASFRIAAVLAALLRAASAGAAEVALQAPPGPVDAGIPFEIALVVENPRDASIAAPPLPEVAGLELVGTPSRREMTFTMNRTTTVTVTFSYALVARAPGRYEIPAFTVDVDGEKHPLPATPIEARGLESQGLVAVEIAAAKQSVYLGEPVDLVLRIRLRAYADEQLGVRLAAESMWSAVEIDRSDFGPFRAPLDELTRDRFGRRSALRGRDIQLPAGDGSSAQFYEYELTVRHWPAQAGPLDLGPVTVVVLYPTRLERRRDFFFEPRLEIAAARRVAAAAAAPAVTVRTPPEEGRPAAFSGAVGAFDFAVTAAPTDVAVGDPITLTMTVTDRDGRAKLELLAPPRLERVAALTESFKVHAEPMAGTVAGRTKTFTQTIRAARDGVAEIPPIPFAFFDAQRGAYVTVTSDPIAVAVRPAATVEPGDVVGGAVPGGGRSELTELAGGILANETDPRALLAAPKPPSREIALLVVLIPPIVFLGAAIGQRHVRRVRRDVAYARRRSAGRAARRRLDEARRAPARGSAEAVAAAVAGYVADRRGAPAGALTPAEVIEHLRAVRVAPEVVDETAAVLAECERRRFAGGADGGADALADRAAACIGRLERERLR